MENASHGYYGPIKCLNCVEPFILFTYKYFIIKHNQIFLEENQEIWMS